MPHIRPISDLRNHFTDIAKIVNETNEPIFFDYYGLKSPVKCTNKSIDIR